MDMLSFLKRIKALYTLYNFFHKRQLLHNLPVYRRLGLKKTYYSPVSSKDFAHLPPLDETAVKDSQPALESLDVFRKLPESDKVSLLHFHREGYAVLKKFVAEDRVDRINEEIDQLIGSGKVKPGHGNKILFAFRRSHLLRELGEDPDLSEILGALLLRPAILFQSINFLKGSEQPTHSDSIHMTTYPLGGLIAAWIALEDIGPDNGPLHYYPGSHLLPYYLNADYDNEGSRWLLGPHAYDAYEKMIGEKLKTSGLRKQLFLAKKGDILIWHANLFHGGEPHLDKGKTRKSMVFHYFGKDVVCYHEITQRPALMDLGR